MTLTVSNTQATINGSGSKSGMPVKSLHDLHNKLGIILAHCELLGAEATSDLKTTRHLRAISDAVAAALGIIKRLPTS